MTTRTQEQSPVAAAALDGNNGFSLISNQKLLQLYTSMVRCRMIEERLRTLIEPGKFDGRYAAATGREAALAGVAIDLDPEDSVAPSPNNFLANFIKGLRLDRVISSLRVRGASRETSDNQLEEATGAAQSNKIGKNGKIVAVFRDGDEASLESWNQALSLVDAGRLPMLFVSYSTVQTGLESLNVQSRVEKSDARPYGFPSITVDGSDVVAVYRVATEAITHARKGNGATLIECVTWRSDHHSSTDPILKMEAYLTRKGLFSEELKREAAAAFSSELDAAIEACR